jgi:HD-like signal output (HDOD) protein/signal transduction histidine kinase
VVTKRAIDQLPSLPQVLVQILDAIHSDNADYQRIAQIIRQDAAVATRLISVANSSYFGRGKNCETIERALLFLGTDTVKTIVITTSIKQYFNHFSQQHHQFLNQFWRRSLTAANFAQVLATLTRYGAPDEAYLCGLLSDVGQLMLLTRDDKRYLTALDESNNDQELLEAEQQQFSTTHCQLGSELIDSWSIEGFMSDAVRYHHEPANMVQDAHHLVKIINLANLLSSEGEVSDIALATADKLFGLNESLTRELRSRINEDVDNIAGTLGISIGEEGSEDQHQAAHRQLGERLGELTELAQVNSDLWQTDSEEELQAAIRRALFLTFEVTDSVLFMFDSDNNLLSSKWLIDNNNEEPTFKIPAEKDRSVVSNTLLNNAAQSCGAQDQQLSVIDRQLIRHCKADTLVCWPLRPQLDSNLVGVLAIGANSDQREKLERRSGLATTLCSEIASVLTTTAQLAGVDSTAIQYQTKISEAVHEAGNPLSIIRNYLETLRLKLGEEHSANEGLTLIKEEIDRVGNILLRLNDPGLPEEDSSNLAINQIIEATAKIFSQSICATKQITLDLKLDKNVPVVPGNPAHLKQILTNLLKNAVEAIDEGGKIVVSSDASVSLSGRDFAAITIEDNGPGMSQEVKQKLFSPVSSTKENHAGLGLSIVKKLIDDMDGSIVCRSNTESGTQFQILLPK